MATSVSEEHTITIFGIEVALIGLGQVIQERDENGTEDSSVQLEPGMVKRRLGPWCAKGNC
jgi:hypothetical protein